MFTNYMFQKTRKLRKIEGMPSKEYVINIFLLHESINFHLNAKTLHVYFVFYIIFIIVYKIGCKIMLS